MFKHVGFKSLAVGGLLLTTGSLYATGRSFSSVQCSSLPFITLYQYQTCPFCCKTRAFLGYYGLEYKTVEVNPLFRREIKFSSYKKVPIAKLNGTQINDSSLIISVLRSCMVLNTSAEKAIEMYPEVSFFDDKNQQHSERVNKYFIMHGETPVSSDDIGRLREEREWREWVDTHLVRTFSPNIYRTLNEAFRSFDYISSVGNFNVVEKFLSRYVGALVMYGIGKRLKKKYKLNDDVRVSLYECCNQWMEGIGGHRFFMGGDEPNLADLAVYGTLTALEGLDTFNDMMSNTSISRWYYAMKEKVDSHHGRSTLTSSP